MPEAAVLTSVPLCSPQGEQVGSETGAQGVKLGDLLCERLVCTRSTDGRRSRSCSRGIVLLWQENLVHFTCVWLKKKEHLH